MSNFDIFVLLFDILGADVDLTRASHVFSRARMREKSRILQKTHLYKRVVPTYNGEAQSVGGVNMKTGTKAVLCAALGNIIWGFSFLFIKVGLSVAPDPNVLLAHRFTVSTLLMLGMMVFGGKRISFKNKNWRPVTVLLAMQVTYYLFESYGVVYTNSTIAGLVLATVPVVTIGTGALFLKEYPTRRQALFCIMPIIGVVLMTISGSELGEITWIGMFFLFLTMLSSAFFKTANRKAAEEFTPFERTFLVIAISAVFFTAVGLNTVKWDMGAFFAPLANVEYDLSILALSVFCSIVATILVNYAAGKMSVFKLSSFGALSTLCSTFAGVLILKEPSNWMLFLGGALIIVGIQQVTRSGKKQA